MLYITNGGGDKTSHNFVGLEYYVYNKDIKGSTTNIIDNNKNAKISYKYSDFGETEEIGDTDFYNEIAYTGGIYDENTSLYYLNARYYNPEDARFITQDTYRGEVNNPSSLHLYAYCANNPINYVDPSGHNIFILMGHPYAAFIASIIFLSSLTLSQIKIKAPGVKLKKKHIIDRGTTAYSAESTKAKLEGLIESELNNARKKSKKYFKVTRNCFRIKNSKKKIGMDIDLKNPISLSSATKRLQSMKDIITLTCNDAFNAANVASGTHEPFPRLEEGVLKYTIGEIHGTNSEGLYFRHFHNYRVNSIVKDKKGAHSFYAKLS